jgi:hypothetical protein
VDKNGCASDQRDSDADGMVDKIDDCPFEKQLATPRITMLNDNTLSTSLAGYYQWYKDGVRLVGETNQQISVLESGNYAVEIKSAAGCLVPRSAEKTVLILGTTNQESAINIFPNPVKDYLNIQFDAHKYPVLHIQLVDMQGKIWWQKTDVHTNERIPMSALPTGTFVLKFENGLKSIKIQKQ